jgi:UDP-N-acetylmuramoyl-tripeptide--D-alanyl-D-alanine ligase
MGAYAAECGLDGLWGVGPELAPAVEVFGKGGRWFATLDEAQSAVAGAFGSDSTVLVKGSRGAQMEQLLPALLGETESLSC